MSDSVKKIAKVAGVVALGYATFGIGSALVAGKTLGAALSTGAGFAGLSYSTLGQIGAGLAAVGAGADKLSSTPTRTSDETGANSRGAPKVDPNAVGVYAFGKTTVPPYIVYEA